MQNSPQLGIKHEQLLSESTMSRQINQSVWSAKYCCAYIFKLATVEEQCIRTVNMTLTEMLKVWDYPKIRAWHSSHPSNPLGTVTQANNACRGR